jgi:hypothetical protein
MVATQDGKTGFTTGPGVGGGVLYGAGGSLTGLISNARTLEDLEGNYAYVEGSVGEGPIGTANMQWCRAPDGFQVRNFNVGGGAGGEAPLPFSVTGGWGHTTVYSPWGT